MQQKVFIGEHNFKAFKNGNKDYLTEVRNIFESKIVCKDSIIEYMLVPMALCITW